MVKQKEQEDKKEDVSRYRMTLRKREDTGLERRNTRSHSVENSSWKRTWSGRKTA
jgi:hypothetical protein